MPQAALAVAVWVGSSVAFAATAAGASMAVAAAVGYATIGATLAAEVYAVNKVTSAITPKIKDPGTATTWQADPRAGIPLGLGRSAIAGNIVFNQSAGSSNKYLNFATVYSAGPIQAFEAFQANGVTVSFTADGGEGASGYYLNRLWLKTQLGAAVEPYMHWTATGSKDTPANHGGMPNEWTSAHRLSGYAASFLAAEYDTKIFSSGVPTPRMIGRWALTYDARQDSTYPGGAADGGHRWNDPSTWSWSRDPYRYGLTWCIGYRNGGVLTHGYGADLSEIDVAAFVAGSNVADANGWTLGGQISSSDDKWEVLKAILQAGAGVPILGGTKVSCMVNAPAVSLATLTEADIVGTMTVPAQVSALDRINTVWPSYTEEALDWQVVTPDAPIQVAEYLADDVDGEERSVELGLPLVQDATQVGQLSRYAIEDARELTGIVLKCKPWTMWIPPGACVTVNSVEAGLNGQKIRVQKRTRDLATKTVTFISRTETDGKHPFALGQTNVPPADPTLTGYDVSVVPLPADDAFAIIDGKVAGADGSLPAIVLHGEADLYEAVSIVVDYRRVLPLPVGDWKSKSFPASATTLVVDGVEAGATYQTRIRYITAKGVENPGTGTDLGTVIVGGVNAGTVGGKTTAQIVADAEATSAPAIAAAQAAATAAQGSANTALSNVAAEILRAQGAEGTLSASIVSLTGTVNGNTSAISAEGLTRQTADTALAALINSLTSTVGANKASADSSIAALSTADTAMAASVSSLTGTVGANKASADSSILALSNDQSALASSVNGLKAASSVNPNLVQNGGAQRGFGDWIGASFVVQDIGGPYGPRLLATTNGQAVWSPPFSATAGVQYTASAGLLNYPIGYCQLFIAWYTTTDGTGAVSWSAVQVVNSTGGAFVRAAITRTAPAGAQSGRLYWYAVPNGEPNSQIRQVKVEEGAIATLWSDDASVRSLSASYDAEVVVRTSADAALAASDTSLASAISGNTAAISNNYTTLSGVDSSLALSLSNLSASTTGLSATVTSQGAAIVDVAGKVAAGRFVLSTAAGGGKPNRFTMYSDSLGTNFMALEAANIYFGDNTVFDDATDTLRTVTGSVARVIAWGAVFGASGANLLEWIGDSAVALGSMSKANAYYYTSTTAPYVGGSGLPSGGSTDAVLSKIAEVSNIAPNSTSHVQQVYVDMTGVLATDLFEAMVEFSQEAVGALPSGAAWHGGWELIEETTSSGSIAVLASGTVDVLETGGGLLDLTTSPEGFFTLSGRSLTGAVRYALRVWKTGGTNLGVPGIHALIRVRRTP